MTERTHYIKEWRERAGLSQEKLSEIIDVSRSAVTQWDSGVNNPAFKHLPAIAKALGCEIPDLFRDPTAPSQELRDLLHKPAIWGEPQTSLIKRVEMLERAVFGKIQL